MTGVYVDFELTCNGEPVLLGILYRDGVYYLYPQWEGKE